ncbi:hypothetical protein MalM14_18070 [Gimesia chilikensis]|nr:hypothetical protein MalM14_18070 [Gimesia chilikensis]
MHGVRVRGVVDGIDVPTPVDEAPQHIVAVEEEFIVTGLPVEYSVDADRCAVLQVEVVITACTINRDGIQIFLQSQVDVDRVVAVGAGDVQIIDVGKRHIGAGRAGDSVDGRRGDFERVTGDVTAIDDVQRVVSAFPIHIQGCEDVVHRASGIEDLEQIVAQAAQQADAGDTRGCAADTDRIVGHIVSSKHVVGIQFDAGQCRRRVQGDQVNQFRTGSRNDLQVVEAFEHQSSETTITGDLGDAVTGTTGIVDVQPGGCRSRRSVDSQAAVRRTREPDSLDVAEGESQVDVGVPYCRGTNVTAAQAVDHIREVTGVVIGDEVHVDRVGSVLTVVVNRDVVHIVGRGSEFIFQERFRGQVQVGPVRTGDTCGSGCREEWQAARGFVDVQRIVVSRSQYGEGQNIRIVTGEEVAAIDVDQQVRAAGIQTNVDRVVRSIFEPGEEHVQYQMVGTGQGIYILNTAEADG